MDETVLKIALAAFMHDIGKFADRNAMEISDEFMRNHADLYQPYFGGRHTHPHAVFTAAFIEQMKDLLPRELDAPPWGTGDAFVNLAAGHHRPETPLQWMIAVADRLSSGWDRIAFNNYNQQADWRDFRKVRLLPLFERLNPENEQERTEDEEFRYCYPLQALSATSIFPQPVSIGAPKDRDHASKEYGDLFERFKNDLGKLLHRTDSVEPGFCM